MSFRAIRQIAQWSVLLGHFPMDCIAYKTSLWVRFRTDPITVFHSTSVIIFGDFCWSTFSHGDLPPFYRPLKTRLFCVRDNTGNSTLESNIIIGGTSVNHNGKDWKRISWRERVGNT